MSWSINPPTRTKRTGLGWWAKIGINVQSILSAEAFGTALVARVEYISGAGNIASAQAIGAHVLSRGPVSITPAGIVSLEAFGSPKIGPPGILPVSIITAEALGNPSISVGGVNVAPSGIVSAELIGTAALSRGPVSIVPGGIASAETLGAPSLLATYDITASGIITAEAIGAPTVSTGPVDITGAGNIATAEALGAHALSVGPVSIVPSGLISAEALGNASLSRGPVSIAPSGIVSAETIGAQTISVGDVSILPSAIPTQEAIGTAAVAITQFLSPLSANRNECDDPYLEYRTLGGYNTSWTDEWAWAGTYSVALVPTAVAQSYYTPPRYGTNGAVASSVGETWTFHCIAHAPADNVATIQLAAHYALTGADGNPNIYPTKFNLALAPGETKVLSYSHTIQEGYNAIRFTPALGSAYYPNRVLLDAFYQTRDTVDMSYLDIGAPVLSVGPVSIVPSGIVTGEAIGALTVSRDAVNLAPAGIAGAEAIGSPSISRGPVSITPSGLASGEAFGSATISVSEVNVAPTGIASTEAIGTQSISRGPVNIAPTGIASGEAFGSPGVVDHSVRYMGSQNLGTDSSSSTINDTLPTVNMTIPAGTDFLLISLAGYKSSSAIVTFTVTVNGGAQTVTAVGSPVYANNDSGANQSWQQWFALANPPTGTVSLEISRTATGFVTLDVQTFARYYQNVASITNLTNETGTESGSSMSISFNSTTAGAIVVCAMGADNFSSTQYLTDFNGDNALWAEPAGGDTSVACGDRRGGTTVSFTATRQGGYDYYETVVELIPT